jgi:hypothetical protein
MVKLNRTAMITWLHQVTVINATRVLRGTRQSLTSGTASLNHGIPNQYQTADVALPYCKRILYKPYNHD